MLGFRHLNSAGVLDGRREAQLKDACSEMAGGVLGPLELAGQDALGQCRQEPGNVVQHCIRHFGMRLDALFHAFDVVCLDVVHAFFE